MIHDLRTDHSPPKLLRQKWYRSWQGSSPRVIRGVTLHQTGCELSNNPARWNNLNAHIGITRNGQILFLNDLRAFIWHAQGLSHSDIGIEFAGNFEGIQGQINTLWKPGGGPHRLTDEQLRAANEELFPWLLEQFEDNGGKWQYVHAHRQACADRRADPGSEIWQRVCMVWIEKLGASDGGPDWKYGDGRAIPREWDPSYSARY